MQLATAFQTVEDGLARTVAKLPPRLPYSFRPGDPAGLKPATGQQARVALCKNLIEERRAQSSNAEGWKQPWNLENFPASHEPSGSERHTGTCRGRRPGCGERPPFIALLAASSWNCCSAQRQGKHRLTLSQQQRTVGNGFQLHYFFFFTKKTKRDPDLRQQRGLHFPAGCHPTLAGARWVLGCGHAQDLHFTSLTFPDTHP